ncbi:TetR/AcrR family transcriptional regulator [Streptomyces sp. SB3404]|uniref:TetR/AcrR family transcriptional regulator n=1 Tax=Streptomyces boncukensis TaxID=2711219 RepID=A0A6G4X6B0_9ACTN|nr:TetR/AcrR family transcriptional regulator [Streptomyces boncukensis]
MARDAGTGSGAPARRGRPRSEAVERAIIEGVLHLLEEGHSLDSLTIEGIARTAGVGKAAVYRRWSGKDELLIDVMRRLEEPLFETADEAPLREVLITFLEGQRRRALAKREFALIRSMVAHVKHDSSLWRQYQDTVITARRERLHAALERAVAAGELRDDIGIQVLADLIVGPMLVRTILRPDDEVPEDLSRTIVDGVLEGIRPRGHRDPAGTSRSESGYCVPPGDGPHTPGWTPHGEPE